MGLRTQLYALEDVVVSPCYRDDYTSDWEKQTIGETAYQIPLPWLAMFRVGDIRAEEVPLGEEGGSELRIAPVTTMENAKMNLCAACDVVSKAFPKCPKLASYLEMMIEEIAQFDFPYVTIDATELYPEIELQRRVSDPWRAVLSGFDSPDTAAAYVPATLGDRMGALFGRPRKNPWLVAINSFVEFDPDQSLPHPDYEQRGDHVTAEESQRHATLLTGGVYHTSIWQR